MSMKRIISVFILLFFSIGFIPLVNPAPAASAIVSTNKINYSFGETVHFTLTNTGITPINCTTNNPWTIYKQSGGSWQTVYVPGIALENWTLNPGGSRMWSWSQTSNAMVTIDAATYKVEINISGVGTWSTTFTIGSGGGGWGTGSLRIYNSTSDYRIYIDGAYYATAITSVVTIYNLSSGTHQIKLTKTGCEDIEQTVSIMSGMTTTIHVTMVCGGSQPPEEEEKDDDEDGVLNSNDRCYNPGCTVVDSNGCPKDSDNDGVNDCEDECPREKGILANDGCPVGDSDGDGVPDDEDSCYNVECTLVDSHGCPRDTDDDGLNDCDDDCPNEYGERRNNGCPEEDADSDGVPDGRDNCYNPGCSSVDSRGCPYDSDSDGLNDCEDNCPNQSGPRTNNGCPQQQSPSFCLGTSIISLFVLIGMCIIRFRSS